MASSLTRCLRSPNKEKSEAVSQEDLRPVIPPYGSQSRMREEELRDIVDKETPEDRWFTREHGWPKDFVFDGDAPPNVLPPLDSTPSLKVVEEDILGELRVEILEARNLPKQDFMSGNDVYAFFLFEENAAATSVLWNTMDPVVWHVGCPRALRFPVRRPCSSLYMALLDSDETGLGLGLDHFDDDDAMGRCMVHLPSLYANTVYDGWRPLQRLSTEPPSAEFGEVRLRISIKWKSERQRLLSYLEPSPPFNLPLEMRRWQRAALFALQGKIPDHKFAWPVTKAYLYEGMDVYYVLNLLYFSFDYLVYYYSPSLSLLVLGVWQLTCLYPALIPACYPFSVMMILNCTYSSGSRSKLRDVRRAPSFWSLLYAFTFGKLPGITAEQLHDKPEAPEGPSFENELEGFVDESLKRRSSVDIMDVLSNTIEGVGGALQSAGSEIKNFNVQSVGEGVQDIGKNSWNFIKGFNKGATEAVRDINLNPLALIEPYLSPVQFSVANKIRKLRKMRGLFTWSDPIASSWVYVALAGVTTSLVLISPILKPIMQLTGLYLFGPQNLIFGQRKRAKEAAEAKAKADLEEEFRNGDEVTRRRLLMEKNHELKRQEAEEAAAARQAELDADAAELRRIDKLPPKAKTAAQARRLRNAAWEKKCEDTKAAHPGHEDQAVITVPSFRLAEEKHPGELDPYAAHAYPLPK